MLRLAGSAMTRLSINTETKCGPTSYALEFVRWRRKPRWLPVAKSKMFRVPERRKQAEEEREEIKRLYNNYYMQMRSLMQYFREEAKAVRETTTADHIVLTPEQQEAEYQQCLAENEAWNAKIAQEREARLENERKERREDIERRKLEAKQREEKRLEKIESIVRKEKELAKTFIKRENLDDAIAAALANPVDYNFAIDLQGNIYEGRNTLPGGGAGGGDKDEQAGAAGGKDRLEAQNQ